MVPHKSMQATGYCTVFSAAGIMGRDDGWDGTNVHKHEPGRGGCTGQRFCLEYVMTANLGKRHVTTPETETLFHIVITRL